MEALKFILSGKLRKCLSRPLGVVFYVTWRCNLRCKHCNLWKSTARRRELGLKDIMGLLFELKRLGVKEVNYSGGEPLLKDDFDRILWFGRSLGFKQYVSTNATMVNEYWASILAKTCDAVFVSLEGPEEVDDHIRGEGHFRRALRAIKLLERARKGIAGIALALAPYNAKVLSRVCELCLSLGIKMSLQLVSPQGVVFPADAAKPVNYGLDVSTVRDVARCIIRYRNVFSGSDEYYLALLRTLLGARKRPCVVAYRRLTIDPRGYIYPCSLWPKPVGHINDGVLNVWFSEVFEEERLRMRQCMACFLGCYEPDNITYEMFSHRVMASFRKYLKRLL